MSMGISKSLQGEPAWPGELSPVNLWPLLIQGQGSSIPTTPLLSLYYTVREGCPATFGRVKTTNSGHPILVGYFYFYFFNNHL